MRQCFAGKVILRRDHGKWIMSLCFCFYYWLFFAWIFWCFWLTQSSRFWFVRVSLVRVACSVVIREAVCYMMMICLSETISAIHQTVRLLERSHTFLSSSLSKRHIICTIFCRSRAIGWSLSPAIGRGAWRVRARALCGVSVRAGSCASEDRYHAWQDAILRGVWRASQTRYCVFRWVMLW